MKKINIPNLNKKMIIGLIPVIALLVLVAIYSLNLLFIIISISITYKIFNPLLDPDIFNTKIIRATLIVFVYLILLQAIIISSWVINRNFSLDAIPLLTMLFMALILIYNHLFLKFRSNNTKIKSPIKIPIIKLSDILSLIIAVSIIAIVMLPSIASNGGINKKSSIISLTSGNVDDAAHLGLLNDRLQLDRGIIYHSDATENVRAFGLYPAGWHSANAVVIKAIDPTISVGIESLIAYTFSKIFWFFILLFIFSKIIFILYKTFCNKRFSKLSLLWIASSSFIFSYLFLVDVFRIGFYSFIPQLIAALLLIPVLIQLSLINKKTYQQTLLVIAILCVGGCLSWLLVLPAFLLIVCLVLYDKLKDTKLRYFIDDLWHGILNNIFIYGLIIVAMATQLYVMLTDHSNGSVSFVQGILLNGGIAIYKAQFYLFIFVGIALCLFLISKSKEKILRYMFYIIMSLLLFAGLLYMIQIIYLGKNAYYYYKALDVFTVVAIPLCVIGFALCFDHLSDKKSKALALITIPILMLIIIQFIGLDPAVVSYTRGNRLLTNTVNESVYQELKYNATQENYYNKNYIFYYVPGNIDQNEIATMTIKSNKPDGVCFNATRLSFLTSSDFNAQLEVMRKSCQDNTVDIITDTENIDVMKDAVNNLGLQNIVKIITYSDTFLKK